MRPIGPATLIVLAAIASACARDLYVDAGAPTGGTGSKAKPFKTIREGVTAARVKTTVHVAEGTYVEELDTIVAHDEVRLKGSTVLSLDERGLPKGGTQHAAIVRPKAAIPTGTGQALFQIRARNVRIAGLEIDGKTGETEPSGVLINIDGAQAPADGFSIEGNVLVNATAAVVARMAAGKIRGNYITRQSQGVLVFGRSLQPSPPREMVHFERNRVTENRITGALFFGSVGSLRRPTFQSLGLNERAGALRIDVSNNDFLRNGSNPSVYPSNSPNTGAYFLFDSTASDPTQPARIDADIHDNTFIQNVWYGVVVGQRIEPTKQPTGYVFEGTFERNRHCGNGLNAAAFDFRHICSLSARVSGASWLREPGWGLCAKRLMVAHQSERKAERRNGADARPWCAATSWESPIPTLGRVHGGDARHRDRAADLAAPCT